jgi:hypothetical protein
MKQLDFQVPYKLMLLAGWEVCIEFWAPFVFIHELN